MSWEDRSSVDVSQVRAGVHAQLVAHAREVLRAQPALRSMMFTLAQYWCDEAHDAVHLYRVASERDVPVWPHACGLDDGGPCDLGETCRFGATLSWDSNGDDAVAFAAFCYEGAHQEMALSSAHLPYAIARRGADDVELEIVAHVERPAQERTSAAPLPWPDARATELFAQVVAAPDDDGPRHVLADHLMEIGDPRGAYIAAALAGRAPMLDRATRLAWMQELGDVVLEGSARFERGLVAHVEVFDDGFDGWACFEAPAWGTVASIAFAPGSAQLLAPTMTALREVGTLEPSAFDELLRPDRSWAIETLAVHLEDRGAMTRLRDATTLPRLRHLIVDGDIEPAVAELRAAAWWPQLARLTVRGGIDAMWYGRRDAPEIAVQERSFGRPIAWELAFVGARVEVAMRGWFGSATLASLAVRLRALPGNDEVVLVGTRYFAPAAHDVEFLGRETGRTVVIKR